MNTDPAYNDTESLPDAVTLKSFVNTHQISHTGRLTHEDVDRRTATRLDFGRFFGLTDRSRPPGWRTTSSPRRRCALA